MGLGLIFKRHHRPALATAAAADADTRCGYTLRCCKNESQSSLCTRFGGRLVIFITSKTFYHKIVSSHFQCNWLTKPDSKKSVWLIINIICHNYLSKFNQNIPNFQATKLCDNKIVWRTECNNCTKMSNAAVMNVILHFN